MTLPQRCLFLILVAGVALVAAKAQAPPPAAGTATTDPAQKAQHVSTRSPLTTVGEPRVENFFDLDLRSMTGYTSNVGGGATHVGSMFEDTSAGVEAQQKRGGLNWALSYSPSYDWYRTARGFDRLNQAGAVQISDQLSDHWYLRLSDTASYGRFLLNPAALNGQPSGPLNVGVATPRALQFSQTPGASLVYIANYRNSFTFSGDYIERRFSGQGSQSLSNLEGAGGSAAYQYRLSPRATVGVQYAYENASFGPGVGHMVEQTATLTFERVLGPNTEVSLGAGPERVHETENLPLLLGLPPGTPLPATAPITRPYRTYFAAQGALTHRAGPVALNFSVQQAVRDAGGLAAAAAYITAVTAGAGRRLGESWHAHIEASYERMTAANLLGAAGSFQGVVAGGGLSRQLGPAWQLAAQFTSSQQHGPASALLPHGFNYNSASLGVFYNWRLHRG